VRLLAVQPSHKELSFTRAVVLPMLMPDIQGPSPHDHLQRFARDALLRGDGHSCYRSADIVVLSSGGISSRIIGNTQVQLERA
jgi:hypothetical protein